MPITPSHLNCWKTKERENPEVDREKRQFTYWGIRIWTDFLTATTQARSQKNEVLEVLNENKTFNVKF